MAIITLADIKILWDNVSAWVKGTDAVSAPKVTVDSSALPTGASTSAKQDTLIGHVDGVETLLTAIKDTDGIKKITDALPAGTNLIGKVGIDQTSDGTTNRVVAKISQVAGENVVGFGGTAQPVILNGSLTNIPVELQAGAEIAGKFGIDQTAGQNVVKLSDRVVEEIIIYNALAIRDTDPHPTSPTPVDLKKYKNVQVIVYSSLDQVVTLNFYPDGGTPVKVWSGTEFVGKPAAIPAGGTGILLNTFWDFLNQSPFPAMTASSMLLTATCTVAPLSGSLTVTIEGVPN